MSYLISTGSIIPGAKVDAVAWQGVNLQLTRGNPSGLIIASEASGLALDILNGSLFMAVDKASKDWIALGSAEF